MRDQHAGRLEEFTPVTPAGVRDRVGALDIAVGGEADAIAVAGATDWSGAIETIITPALVIELFSGSSVPFG